MDWYNLHDPKSTDSPSLLVFPERAEQNIKLAIEMAGSVDRLRPHIKTCKSPEAIRLMQKHGIYKFKCATISEAEMLGMENARDVLLAYQPVGPKLERFISLVKKYPGTKFSCLVDNMQVAQQQVKAFSDYGLNATVYVDINVGMNRTGIPAGPEAVELLKYLLNQPVIEQVGIHIYDGHMSRYALNERE